MGQFHLIHAPYTVPLVLYKRSITIDHTKCGASNSTNFPVMVSISDSTFKTTSNGGHVTNSSGYDVMFYSDSGYTTLLNWEIDSYDPVNGILVAWIKIGTASHTVDTVFYVRYGNSAITTFQGGAVGSVWSSDYKSVYHFGNGTTLSLADSTANANTLTNNGATAQTGLFSGAVYTDGSTTYLTSSDSGFPTGTSDKTVSFWAQSPVSFANATASVMSYGVYTTNELVTVAVYVAGNYWYISQYGASVNGPATVTTNTWYYVVVIITGSTYTVYVNNVANSGTMGTNTTLNGLLYIGRDSFSSLDAWNGLIDEMRISNVAKSADWLTTEYNNQNSPGNIGSPSFLTYSVETT